MIASVSGVVQAVGAGSVVVRAGSFGISVFCTPSLARTVKTGEAIEMHTSLQVREDSLSLYGFLDDGQLNTFELLLTVSGVGPKLALAIIDALTPDAVASAIQNDDDSAFRSVSGVGPKTAKLIILALSGKISHVSSKTGTAKHNESDIVEALVGLGWPSSKVRDAIAAGDISDLAPAVAIREILRRLSEH